VVVPALVNQNEENKLFLPIPTEHWACPAGHRRELMGIPGYRRLRCRVCEGWNGHFLTREDHEFLRNAGVKIEAINSPCLRPGGKPRAHFMTREKAEAFRDDPRNRPVYDEDEVAGFCLKCGYWHLAKREWLISQCEQL